MFKQIILAAMLLLLPLAAQAEDKALARIEKKGEINCGVYTLGSIFSYDPAGKPQGFTVDLMTEIARRAGVKVKYSEISSFATLRDDLNSGKFDMICTPVLLIPATAMKYLPGSMLMIDPINIYAEPTTDTSRIKTLTDLNNAQYTFVGMDNELGGIYVPQLFPQAKLNLLAIGAAVPQMFLELKSKKAQFIVLSRLAANAYLQQNPGQLKQVTQQSMARPSVRQLFPLESPGLQANINAFVDELRQEGLLAQLLKKHNLSAE